MKVRLLFALVGLAISFALPTYAQQKDLADPQTTQKLLALGKADEEAHNNRDPAASALGLLERRLRDSIGGNAKVLNFRQPRSTRI